jgi:tRNA (cytosine49-C5)-methyltransferase
MEQFNNADEIEFKDKWVERYSSLTDWEVFKKISLSYLRRSLRVNTLKKSIEDVKASLKKKGWLLKQVPWCKEGFWLDHVEGRRDIGNTEEHSLGYIYIQEAASMIPPVVLDPQPGELILDMCAAPGSKSSQIAQYMNNEGILVSNDFQGIRLAPLGINMQRCGIRNVVVSLMQGQWFKGLKFDRILVDAPCSGTGTVRKSLKTLRIWNPVMVKRLCGTQKSLIATAFNNLKVGGTMVYSTCSLEPEEDEGVVDFLLNKYDNAKIEEIELDIKRSSCVTSFEGKEYSPEVKKCLRLWPQDNDTEGFFVAKIKKI